MLDPLVDSLADEDRGPILLVQPFEACCQIHAIAQYRVIHALRRTHISHYGIAEMDAKANTERPQPLGFELSIERVARRLGRKGGATGALDMIELQMGGVPKYHHRVSDELVHSPALDEKRFRQRGEMARGLVHQTVGVGGFGNAGKILNIGKQDRDLLPYSTKLGRDGTIDDPPDDILRNKAGEGPDGALGERHGIAEFVNLGDTGCDRCIIRRR
jgi:hypothetical protein